MEGQSSKNIKGLKILIYEHVSGGGYAEQPLSPSMLAEGFAMLRGLVADFKAAGHETTVLLDERISRLNAPLDADNIIPVCYAEEPQRFIKEIAKINDAWYIIAPETARVLEEKVKLIEQTGKMSLNCKSNAIGKVADKTFLYETLQDMGFPIPKTLILNCDAAADDVLQTVTAVLKFPFVFKPVDGTGCNGLSIIKNDDQIEQAINRIKQSTKSKRFIVQEYIDGASASVSLISNGKKALALSLNRQMLVLSPPDTESRYEGGCVPFKHPREQDAFVLAQKVVEAFPGLRGYVGVDLVLTSSDVFVVDVNPRLTTSYVGLRRVGEFNLAQLIVDALVEGKLPKKTETIGAACFSKKEVSAPTSKAYLRAIQSSDVVSPPFHIDDNSDSCALMLGRGADFTEAKTSLEEAKKNLQNIFL